MFLKNKNNLCVFRRYSNNILFLVVYGAGENRAKFNYFAKMNVLSVRESLKKKCRTRRRFSSVRLKEGVSVVAQNAWRRITHRDTLVVLNATSETTTVAYFLKRGGGDRSVIKIGELVVASDSLECAPIERPRVYFVLAVAKAALFSLFVAELGFGPSGVGTGDPVDAEEYIVEHEGNMFLPFAVQPDKQFLITVGPCGNKIVRTVARPQETDRGAEFSRADVVLFDGLTAVMDEAADAENFTAVTKRVLDTDVQTALEAVFQ